MMNEDNGIKLETAYFDKSDASGALYSFVFITDGGYVDFSRSFLLALDRNTSHNHTLPFDLHPGRYRMFVYDIEHNGTLNNGVGYPAGVQFIASWKKRGMQFASLHNNNIMYNYNYILAVCMIIIFSKW